MICPQCQSMNPDEATVCSSCEAEIPPALLQIDPTENPDPSITLNNDISSAELPRDEVTSEELNAQAELLSRKIREKRARAALASASSSNSQQPEVSEDRLEVEHLEREMSMLLGLVIVSVVGISGLMFYLNMPEDQQEQITAFVSKGREETTPVAHAQPMETIQARLEEESPHRVMENKVVAEEQEIDQSMIPETEPVAIETEATKESSAEPVPAVVTNIAETTDDYTLPAAMAKQHATASTSPVGTKASSAMQLAAVNKSIESNKMRKREIAGCDSIAGRAECTHRYVVTFKRFWGPILEEGVYPTREMSIRARELWYREGKILEIDGSINDAYVIKPKAFAPVPGFPTS